VHLTQVKGRGRERKATLMDNVQGAADEYERVFVFACENLRSDLLKDVRAEFRDSRFFFGKNKVVRLALGRNREEAYKPGMELLAAKLAGEVGLLFTNRGADEVQKEMGAVAEMEFAKSGFRATRKVTLPAGPVLGQPSSMIESMRSMLLPVKLVKGVIELENEHVVCEKGDQLSPEQARALKLFDIKLAEFRVQLCWLYESESGKLTELAGAKYMASKLGSTTGENDNDDESDDEMAVETTTKKTTRSSRKAKKAVATSDDDGY
jgi:mRNA turnover protein 4